MFCNQCGSPLGADQLVCPTCGRSIAETRATVEIRTRVFQHLNLLAIFWFVLAAFRIILAAIMFALAALSRMGDMQTRMFGPILFGGIGAFLLVLGAATAVTGYGLLKIRPWGRVLTLVMSFVNLLEIPLGAALSIYTLVILLPSVAGEEYERLAARGRTATNSWPARAQ